MRIFAIIIQSLCPYTWPPLAGLISAARGRGIISVPWCPWQHSPPWVWGSAGCCGAPVSCLLVGGGLHGIVTTLYLKGTFDDRISYTYRSVFLETLCSGCCCFFYLFFSLLVFFVMLFDFTLAVVFVCFNNVFTVLFVVPLFC